MAYCINCGQQLADGTSFCTNCGAPQMSARKEPYEQKMSADGYDSGQGAFTATGGYDNGQGSYNTSDGYSGGQGSFGTSGSYSGGQGSYGTTGGYNGGQGSYGTSGGYGGGPTPSMSFGEAVRTCLTQKYANFSGRARRSEYWYYSLFASLVSLAATVLQNIIFGGGEGSPTVISSLVSLALFLPGLGVSIRRLHDIGKSAWWYLLILVPVIGWIVLIVFYCTDSAPGSNKYGPNPKYPG